MIHPDPRDEGPIRRLPGPSRSEVIEGLAASGLPIVDPVGAGSSLSGSAGDTFLALSDGTLPPGGSATFNVPIVVPNDGWSVREDITLN